MVPFVVAVSLLAGFAVAQFSGIRLLGAGVLIVGGAWCAVIMWQANGPWRTVIVAVVYVAAFALSHPLGGVIGTWPAVIGVAVAAGFVAYAVMRPGSSRVSTASPATRSTR